jgi:DeoR family transcriptional regulator, catabolite repression regulator
MFTHKTRDMLVEKVMLQMGKFPVIARTVILKEALEEMNKYSLGIVCIVDDDEKLLGIFTDGDIRRQLLSIQKPSSAFFIDDALDHSTKTPLTAQISDKVDDVIKTMGDRKIWDLPVLNESGKLVGLLHLHPVVEALFIEKR